MQFDNLCKIWYNYKWCNTFCKYLVTFFTNINILKDDCSGGSLMENIGITIMKELEALNPAVKFKMYFLADNPRPIIYGNVPAIQLKFPNDCHYDEKTLIANKHNDTGRYESFVYAYNPFLRWALFFIKRVPFSPSVIWWSFLFAKNHSLLSRKESQVTKFYKKSQLWYN